MDLKNMFEQVQLLKVKSVIDPIFKIAMSILILAVISITIRPETWMPIALFGLACVFFVFGLVGYCYFMLKDPTALRSEEHEFKMKALGKLTETGKDFRTNDLLLLTNPFPELTEVKMEKIACD